MKSINWDYVLVLVRSRYFVRDVVQYFKKPDLEWLFYSGADCLRDFIDVRDVYNNNFHDVKKSILLALCTF